MENPIRIKVKLASTEFIKLSFIVAYTNPLMLFLTIVGLFQLYALIDYWTENPLKRESFPIFNVVFALLFLVVFPVSAYWQAKKNLRDNKWINQTLEYDFDKDIVSVTGESFKLTMNWTDLKTIRKLKKWFLLYTNNRNALFIPKDRFNNLEEEKSFKQLVSTIRGVKLKLKK